MQIRLPAFSRERLLDRVDQFDDFDPMRDYQVVVSAAELSAEERAKAGIERSIDDIALALDDE